MFQDYCHFLTTRLVLIFIINVFWYNVRMDKTSHLLKIEKYIPTFYRNIRRLYYKVYKKKSIDKYMQNIKKYSIIAILTLSVVAGIFNNIPLSYAQDNSTMTNTL